MSLEDISMAELVAARQHSSGGALHLVVLGMIAVIALVIYGVVRWRRRRARAEAQPTSPDLGEVGEHSSDEE
jgi:hypothetical protein